MFVLGHVGIGRAIVGARARALPFVAFAIGAMLPDIVDKPLYYSGLAPDFFSCTRTLGHTGLFAGLLIAVGLARRSRVCLAAGIACLTHAALDFALDLRAPWPGSTAVAFLWPFYSTHFFVFHFDSPADQIFRLWRPDIVLTETIGLGCLIWEYVRRRPRQ